MRNIGFIAVVAVLQWFVSAEVSIRVNQIGYELDGPKTAVVQSSTTLGNEPVRVLTSAGTAILDADAGPLQQVAGWKNRYFCRIDFSSLKQEGTYRLSGYATISPSFTVRNQALQARTSADVIGFFTAMRNTSSGDRSVPFFGGGALRNVYGGWSDATGDRGKYLSHLSFANYYNPQQIPLVIWSLLASHDLQPSSLGSAALVEAAWGADYLLRALDPAGFFYQTVFDNWGWGLTREICAWSGSEGIRSNNYQCGMREGGGMAIASLARAAFCGIRGDSSASAYLSGARRAYAHLKQVNTQYLDDGIENIIDDYCGLLAAAELFNATKEGTYRTDAHVRTLRLLSRQSEQGFLYSDDKKTRPFYHASDEGLPVIALTRFAEIDSSIRGHIRPPVGKWISWYQSITTNGPNPFGYVKLYASRSSPSVTGGTDLARNKPASASQVEPGFPVANAFDGNEMTRWASGRPYTDNAWIQVDLGLIHEVSSVVLNWENAYGARYTIQVSADGKSFSDVALVNDGKVGKRVIAFAPLSARFIRMQGILRGIEYGYSLYGFEVYGKLTESTFAPSAQFFIPHQNETGYWWQGENARLASMAAALIHGYQLVNPVSARRLLSDTLSALITDQLDWIAGKNPFGVCMISGYGEKTWEGRSNYPDYPGKPGYGMANINGGVCNGITGGLSDESDVEWMPYHRVRRDSLWQDWRWIEQWLPQGAWYLFATTSLAELVARPSQSTNYRTEIQGKNTWIVTAKNGTLRIVRQTGQRVPWSVSVWTLNGKIVANAQTANNEEAELRIRAQTGSVMVIRVDNESAIHRVIVP